MCLYWLQSPFSECLEMHHTSESQRLHKPISQQQQYLIKMRNAKRGPTKNQGSMRPFRGAPRLKQHRVLHEVTDCNQSAHKQQQFYFYRKVTLVLLPLTVLHQFLCFQTDFLSFCTVLSALRANCPPKGQPRSFPIQQVKEHSLNSCSAKWSFSHSRLGLSVSLLFACCMKVTVFLSKMSWSSHLTWADHQSRRMAAHRALRRSGLNVMRWRLSWRGVQKSVTWLKTQVQVWSHGFSKPEE